MPTPTAGAASSTTSPASSLAVTAFTATDGRNLYVGVALDDNTQSVDSITDTAGNLYTFVEASDGSLASPPFSSPRTELWIAESIVGNASNVVTVHLAGSPPGSCNIAAAVEEYSGVYTQTQGYLVQSAIGDNGVRVFTNPVQSGNLMIISTAWYHGCSAPPSISDTLGTSWNSVSVTFFDTTNLTVFYGFAPSTGANTVTITCASASFWITGVHEFAHISAFDTSVTATFDSSSSPQNSGNLTTGFNDELLIGAIAGYRNTGTFGIAEPGQYLGSFRNGNDCAGTFYKKAGAAGSYSMNFAQGGGNDHGGIVLLAFRTSGAPDIGAPNLDVEFGDSNDPSIDFIQHQDQNNYTLAAIGFACVSGDTITAVHGTRRQFSVPAATAVGIALIDNTDVYLVMTPATGLISTARDWAACGTELRTKVNEGVGFPTLSPDGDAADLDSGATLFLITPDGSQAVDPDGVSGGSSGFLPPEGNGQIFPPAVFR